MCHSLKAKFRTIVRTKILQNSKIRSFRIALQTTEGLAAQVAIVSQLEIISSIKSKKFFLFLIFFIWRCKQEELLQDINTLIIIFFML